MAEQLSYVIITPHSLPKSRTGGIISRLIARTGLELVGARMFAPSGQLAEAHASTVVTDKDPEKRRIQELIRDYVRERLAPDPKTGLRRRVMMLLFRGEDAVGSAVCQFALISCWRDLAIDSQVSVSKAAMKYR